MALQSSHLSSQRRGRRRGGRNNINIDRQQNANATAQNTESLDHNDRNEPDNDFGPQSDTELLDHIEIEMDRHQRR